MTRKQYEARAHLEKTLGSLGFTADETRSLIRIEMTLHRWAEHECNGNIQREDVAESGRVPYDGKPRWVSEFNLGIGFVIADRERGALKRLDTIVAERNRRVNVGEMKGKALLHSTTKPTRAARRSISSAREIYVTASRSIHATRAESVFADAEFMDAKITVNMDNAAFEGTPASELARILRKLANRIEATGCDYAPIMDLNGNKVGEFNITK